MWRMVLTVTLLSCSSEASVTCKDENDGEVDWYILYKAPRQSPLTGLEYLYIDSTGVRKMVPHQPTASPGRIPGPSGPTYKPINHSDGVLAHTLRPLFITTRSMSPNFGFISYSDQPPGCSADKEFGHSKGVVMVEKDTTGVWLLHSTPKFPFRRDQNRFWPPSGNTNAQTFICVTFPYSQFTHIGKHLQYIRAFPFDHDIPENFPQELRDAAKRVEVLPLSHFQPLTSSKGVQFSSIAKQVSGQPKDGDLYITITQRINSDVLVQMWGCQPRRARSYCLAHGHKVKNIKTIKTDLGSWDAKYDHSKWCVQVDNNLRHHWTCIADVNRAKTQYERPGGALCIDNERIKNLFMRFAAGTEDCTTESIMDIMDVTNPGCVPNTDVDVDMAIG